MTERANVEERINSRIEMAFVDHVWDKIERVMNEFDSNRCWHVRRELAVCRKHKSYFRVSNFILKNHTYTIANVYSDN